MSNSLVNLPKVLFISFCCNWLYLDELTTLDTATCSHADRKLFTSRLFFSNALLQNSSSPTEHGSLNIGCFDWILSRKVSVVNMFLNCENFEGDIDMNELSTTSRKAMSRVKSICLYGSCTELRTTILKSVDFNAYLRKVSLIDTNSKTNASDSFSPPALPSTLQVLQLKNICTLDDSGLIKMQQKAVGLLEFRLVNCHSISDAGVQAVLVQNAEHLHTIVLDSCKSVTEVSYGNILEQCCNLTVLAFKSYAMCTVDVTKLASSCPLLTSLTLLNVTVLSTERPMNVRYFLSHLVELSVELTTDENIYRSVSNLLRVASNLKLLAICNRHVHRGVMLEYARDDHNKNMHMLLSNFSLKLSSLQLYGCVHMTDGHISALVARCTAIRQVTLTKCEDLTDRALDHLLQGAKSLSRLVLTNCKGVTTRGVVELLRSSFTLRELVIRDCDKVQKAGVLLGNVKEVRIVM